MIIAIVNQSSVVTNIEADLITKAVCHQMQNHVWPLWDRRAPAVNFYADPAQVPKSSKIIYLIDTDQDVPDALGFHDEQNANPYGDILCKTIMDNGGQLLLGDYAISSVLSHEVIELYVDPFANYWADTFNVNIDYASVALEACDPVQGDSYTVMVNSVPVMVSNFITPNWCNPQARTGSFDYLGKLMAPFTMSSGGYLIVRDAPGSETQVFGNKMPPEWVQKMRQRKNSRTNKRVK